MIFQNRYAAATITVEDGQTLATGGLYGIVRHPMYSATVVLMIAMALALGFYWALLGVAVGSVLLVVRILDEEKMLVQELPGYAEYVGRVRCRVVPGVW